MCERCLALDERIKSYREIGAMVADERASTAIKTLIEDCEDVKLALHPITGPPD
jgi:hypothetical protein